MNFLLVLSLTFTAALSAATDDAYITKIVQRNALDAQILNAEFQKISVIDPCNSGQTACIAGAPALCHFGSWHLTQCATAESCFAMPKPSTRGTFVACAREEDAESVFAGAGVTGGPINSNRNSTMPLPTSAISTPASVTSAFPSQVSIIATNSVVTVTVTVPATPSITTSSISVTTLSPAEAISVLQSLLGNGGSVIPVIASPSATPMQDAASHASTHSSRTRHCSTSSSSLSPPFTTESIYE